MFECNDNNLLLILGIGIIVLILLKLMYCNNNQDKDYKNLNLKKYNNYENFNKNTYFKKDYKNLKHDNNIEKFEQPVKTFEQPKPIEQVQTFQPVNSFNQFQQFQPSQQAQEQQAQVQKAQIEAQQAQVQQRQQVQQVQQVQQPQQAQQPQVKPDQTTQQISINVPIINDDIFNPNTIEFDYGDALNGNYTLNVNDNPMDVKTNQDKLTSSDLLPGNSDKKWFENPDVGIKIEDANLLSDAVQKVGVDTVGQTRKNPSYDIRGTVPCPKFQISPWNNSTTEPDYNLKSLY